MSKFLVLLIFGVGACAGEVIEERVVDSGVKFRVVRLDPSQVQLVRRENNRKPYETFDRVQKAYAAKGLKVSFLMNAGIFEPGLVPSGLHIEKGRRLRPLNLRGGAGNFFLKPNGVLAVSDAGLATIGPAKQPIIDQVRLAVQSGPLLLIGGNRHPAFREGSSSVKHRNGVGVDDMGRIVFVMTDKRQEVNFWNFAGLFLKLGCQNALFLDGDISQMAVNPEADVRSNRFAAMFVVVE